MGARLATILLAAGVIVGVAASRGGSSSSAALPTVGRVVAAARAPGAPLGLLVTPAGVWVADHHLGVIRRINPATDKVSAAVNVIGKTTAQPARMILVGSSIFAMNYSGSRTVFVNPRSAKVTRVLNTDRQNAGWPVYAAGSLWLLDYSSATAPNPNRLERIDLHSGKVLATLKFGSVQGLLSGAGSVWGVADGSIFRIDPTKNAIVAKIATDAQPFAYAAGSIWALGQDTTRGASFVLRIDPATNAVVATVPLPAWGAVLTANDDAVWVVEGPTYSGPSHLWKIDPTANAVTGQVPIPARYGSELDDLAIGTDGSIWVTCFDTDAVLRIRPS
jgi:hypothetical protein